MGHDQFQHVPCVRRQLQANTRLAQHLSLLILPAAFPRNNGQVNIAKRVYQPRQRHASSRTPAFVCNRKKGSSNNSWSPSQALSKPHVTWATSFARTQPCQAQQRPHGVVSILRSPCMTLPKLPLAG